MKLRAWLFAPALLALSRLLPASGFGLGLRLGAATLVFLIPGAFLSRALGVRGFSGALAWTMAILFGATAVTFAVHASLWLTLALLLVAALAAAPFAARRKGGSSFWAFWMIVAGLVAGITLWWVSGYDGDAFFHLARVQKLLALHDLSLRSVDEFKDGGLHPGYAFPLWHAAVAVIAKLAGVGAPSAFLHLPTVLLPLSFVLVYEAGTTLFASRWAGVATALAEFALLGLASGHGGAYESMALPATASRTLILPALLALVFLYVRKPSGARLASIAAASLAMTVVHPSYSVLVAIGLVGFLAVRALLDQRHDVKHIGAALAAIVVPAGLVVAWLLPIVRETASHSPSRVELNRAFAAYGNELDVFSRHSYRLAPELYGRAGSIAVASLLLLAARRLRLPADVGRIRARLDAGDLRGHAAAVRLPALRRRDLDLPGPKDHRLRAAAVRARRRDAGARGLPAPVGAAGRAGGRESRCSWLYPGDFGVPYRLVDGSPGWLTWVSFGATAAALVAAAIFGRRIPQVEGTPLMAAGAVALFLLPVAVHGYSHWTRPSSARLGLPEKLVSAVRREVPRGDVVFSDPLTAYELAAFAPVYINAAPTTHVADTKANRPTVRRKDALRFFRDEGPLSLARRYGAHWLLIDRARVGRVSFRLPRAYSGSRYVLYRIP